MEKDAFVKRRRRERKSHLLSCQEEAKDHELLCVYFGKGNGRQKWVRLG